MKLNKVNMKKSPLKTNPKTVQRWQDRSKKRLSTKRGAKKAVKRKIKPKKRRKKSDLAKAKEKLWKVTRQLIIKRHGDTCYCCGAKRLVGSNLHIGHYIPSSVCSTELRYDLRNLRPCCYRCNIHLSGNWPAYEKHLVKDGVDVEYLKRRNEETKGESYRLDWYEEQIERYQALL